MSAIAARVDRWVGTSPVSGRDLGVYRMLYAGFLLLSLPRFAWAADLPAAVFSAPPGPFKVLHAAPAAPVLVAIELLLSVALALLLIGCWTPVASAATGVLLVTGWGIGYSYGKIDHTIFLIVAPLVLGLAGWGSQLSVDARRRPTVPGAAAPRPWAVRWLSILLGVGFFMAAWPKFNGGWLSPTTQAVYGYLYKERYVNGRMDLLSDLFVHLNFPLFWEAFDWATLAFEFGVLVAAVSWPTFRFVIAVGALFHLGVWLMMNIPFTYNVVVYAAFVPWGRLLPQGGALGAAAARMRAVPRAALVAGAAVVGPLCWVITRTTSVSGFLSGAVIVVGAVVALTAMVIWGLRVLALLTGRRRGAERSPLHRAPTAAVPTVAGPRAAASAAAPREPVTAGTPAVHR